MDALVGAGGWAYFSVPGQNALTSYARAFSFVEVNSTYYEDPDSGTAAGWRRRVPGAFQFAVRAHRTATHRQALRPTRSARASFARTAKLAERLRAIAVVLETPATSVVQPNDLADLIGAVDLPCPVALEARAYAGRDLPPALRAAMEAHDVADVVDFSRQTPRSPSSLAYGRMFGPGEANRWEFTDDELAAIRERGGDGDRARVAYTFHGVRMYKDAGRFLTYVRTGSFPRATRHIGLASLDEVLSEAATFPATTSELLAGHGWRVIDADEGRRSHASELLGQLPVRRFHSSEEVLEALAAGHSDGRSRN